MIRAEINGNRIYLDSPLSAKEKCQTIPGSRWAKDEKQWHVPLSWSSCKALRNVFGGELVIGDTLMKWAKNELVQRIEPAMKLRDELSFDDDSMEGLYPFQKAGAHFLLTARHSLCGDDVGSGKTVQVLAAARKQNILPALVVCPSSVKRNWARECARWFPEAEPFVIEGTATKRNKTLKAASESPNAFVIINFESMRLHSRLAPYGSIALTAKERTPGLLNEIPFKLVVCDEAHRLQDPKAKQTRAVWSVGHGPSVEYRWALTGTPVTNTPANLWSILHFLAPQEWPSRTKFIDRFCLSSYSIWGSLEVFGLSPETQDEFFSIFDPRFRRMPKAVTLPQLPPIIHERRDIEMSTKQRKAYSQMEERLFSELESGEMVIARNPISQVTRLIQFSSSNLEEVERDKFRVCEPSNKVDALLEDLADINESVVVFAVSRQLIDLASKKLEAKSIQHSIIRGGQTADQRQNNIDQFQSGKTTVCLVVIAAGGTGVNLNRARVGIWLQRPFSNVEYTQSIGRIHRIGSEEFDSVVVIDYVTPNSIEERVIAILNDKAQNLEEVVRDKDTMRRLIRGDDE